MKDELERFVKLREIETLHEKHIYDRREWGCPSAEANAFYSPSKNGFFICLTPIMAPMFDVRWPESHAYAGAILEHEMTHGFDTKGIKYDGEGRLRTWMDEPSKLGFKKMAKCIIHEYDQFCPTPVMGSNCTKLGEATQTENIADNGGLRAAYRNVVEVKGPDPRLPGRLMSGYDHDQLFFLSYANLWCNGAKQATAWDGEDFHSPDKFRIEGTLKNIAAFAAAFNCPANSTYAPKNHCDIWV
ncbi:Protein NEP-17 a [Aphelenchoides avenae]|nr:Protein NEP-17 a [Aphelenchus avenae]